MTSVLEALSTVPDATSLDLPSSLDGGQKEKLSLTPNGQKIEITKDVSKSNGKSHNAKILFEAKTRNIHLLYQLINSIRPFGDFCTLDISSDGMTFNISDENVCKVRLNLNQKVFQTYIFSGVWRVKRDFTEKELYADDTDLSDENQDEDNEVIKHNQEGGFDEDAIVTISLNIASFLETMNIHVKENKSSDTSIECTFRYENAGHPFVMIFEDDLIVERCELSTYFLENIEEKSKNARKSNKEASRSINVVSAGDFAVDIPLVDDSIFRLDCERVLFDFIVKPNILYDIIKDMDDLNTERFILYCNKIREEGDETKTKNNSKLLFISKSKSDSMGYSKLIIPMRKSNIPEFKLFKPKMVAQREQYELEDCNNLSLSSTYHFDYFSKLLKAIKLSKLIKIRKDMNGITSLLLLLGKNHSNNQKNQPLNTEVNGLYGSSIEFVTLESVSIDELSAFNVQPTNTSLLSKLGYNNRFVEQLIKDDHDIQTIRVGNDGHFVTLDDFFGDARAEFDRVEQHKNNLQNEMDFHNHIDEFPASEYRSIEAANGGASSRVRKPSTTKRDQQQEGQQHEQGHDGNVLKLTEQLTMSLLGHAIRSTDEEDLQVENTIVEGESENERGRRRRHPSNNVSRRKKQTNKRKKGKSSRAGIKENDGIETVGGAIEIPLFI